MLFIQAKASSSCCLIESLDLSSMLNFKSLLSALKLDRIVTKIYEDEPIPGDAAHLFVLWTFRSGCFGINLLVSISMISISFFQNYLYDSEAAKKCSFHSVPCGKN